MTEYVEHRIYFELSLNVSINVLYKIAEDFERSPETVADADGIAAKAKVLRRLNMLSKYRIVRKTERTIQLGYGRNVARVWEVID